ncbi:MAG: hypothetical protein ACYDC6_13190 [Acidobacteriaceae bacterium]
MKISTQSKYPIWLTLALVMAFGGAQMFAHAAPQQGAPNVTPPAPPPMTTADRDAQHSVLGPYRLTYTLTEMDGTKRVGSQRYAVVLDADASEWTALNLGTKIPIATAELGTKNLPPQTQISYIDLGVNITARLRQFANGLELNSHVVQSAVDSQQSLLKSPVIRQTSLGSTVLLNENKPLILGNVDTPGSTHSLQIQVELTKLP